MWSGVVDVLGRVVQDVVGTIVADWPYLLLSVLAAAALTVYVGTDRLSGWLRRRRWTGITGALVLGTLTPFCSCGTTAVVLGMLATEAPWAPIVAYRSGAGTRDILERGASAAVASLLCVPGYTPQR